MTREPGISTSVILLRAGSPIEAHRRARRAAELAPQEDKYQRQARLTAGLAVPDWHFNMMNDELRNQQFAAAIHDVVRPESLVLEIGAGSGLLAMLAARGRDGVGARRVVTCESNPVIAETARKVIADNGLADRVTVVTKPSTELVVGVDLPEPADVLVSEIFTVQVVAEGVLQTFEDAKARLLKPQAHILPERAVMRGALVGGVSLGKMARVTTVLGFDLSAFNAHAPQRLHLSGQSFDWMSDPTDLLRFDFLADSTFQSARRELSLVATSSGLCEGVLQWLRLELTEAHAYEIVPGEAAAQHWAPIWYPFEEPVMVQPGRVVKVLASHNRFGVSVSLVD